MTQVWYPGRVQNELLQVDCATEEGGGDGGGFVVSGPRISSSNALGPGMASENIRMFDP